MAASAFSSDEERVISRELDARDASAFTSFQLDIEGTAAHILRSGHKRVALQFPDQLLSHAGRAVASLRLATAANDAAINFFVLGDTSFDGFQVDFVAAQHFNADFIVHYGPVDLEARGPLPVRFVFGVRHLDVNAVVAACAAAFGGDAERVLIVPSLPYAHASDALALELGRSSTAACRGAVICHSDVERGAEEQLGGTVASSSAAGGSTTSNPLTAGDALAQGRLLGRRLSEPLDEEALGGCALIYVGGEDQTLSNLCLLLPSAAVYLYELSDVDPVGDDAAATGAAVSPPPSLRRLELATARRLMRRYFLVQKAREAEVVGVLVGTLSASQRGPMLSALKALCRRAGRKHYVFVMGKLNAAKLANFSEVGVYVLLGSAEHSLLDSKEFYRPVVTPYELHVALSDGAEWTGEYLLDYGRLLPRLRAEEEEEAAASAAGPTAADDEEDDEPQFSALTGRLIAKRPAFGQDASERPRPPAGRREFVVVCHETPAALVQRGKMEINNLPEGRVDLLARCVAASLFYSHGVRKEARVWLLLSDARRAVCCDGGQCRGLRPDERCLASALSRCLAGHPLPGWSTREDVELDALLREVGVGATAVAADGAGTAAPSRLLVMHEAGDPIGPTSSALVPAGGDSALSVPTVTVLGDHLGFTQAEEDCLARCGGARLSLGAVPLLTSQCIIIIHWLLDTSACRCTP